MLSDSNKDDHYLYFTNIFKKKLPSIYIDIHHTSKSRKKLFQEMKEV